MKIEEFVTQTQELLKQEEFEFNAKQTRAIIDTVAESVAKVLEAKDKVKLDAIGTFETRDRAARKGRNPQTGEELDIAATTVPALKPSKKLKDRVKK